MQVKSRVPDASRVTFSPIIPGKIWLAQAYSSSRNNRIIASRTQLLKHLSGYSPSPPEPFMTALGKLSFPAGTFSETNQMQNLTNGEEKEYQSVYAIQGERYLLTGRQAGGQAAALTFNLHPRAYTQFETTDFTDLPGNIQELPISLAGFQKAVITEEGNGAVFQLQFQNGILELTDELEILYSDLGDIPAVISQKDLPQAILDWLAANPPSSGLTDVECCRFVFNKASGYRVIFQNEIEKVQLFFDISGKLRYRYFSATIML